MEHVQLVFSGKGKPSATGIFGLPSPAQPDKFIVFKVISLHPDRRSYLQRAFALAKDDPWQPWAWGPGVVGFRARAGW